MANKEHNLIEFLAWTASVVDNNGFVSRSDKSGTPHTMVVVSGLLDDHETERRNYPDLFSRWVRQREFYQPRRHHYVEAVAAIHWAAGLLNRAELNSYLTNLGTLARLKTVPRRLTGLACALLNEYRKSLKLQEKNDVDTRETSS